MSVSAGWAGQHHYVNVVAARHLQSVCQPEQPLGGRGLWVPRSEVMQTMSSQPVPATGLTSQARQFINNSITLI